MAVPSRWARLDEPLTHRPEQEDRLQQIQQHHNRRSIDAHPPKRSNRASVLTANTDALTETTFSPHSPAVSSTAGVQGLAPRPPSYQQAPAHGPSALNQRVPSRPDRTLESFEGSPAAPEAPRAQPLSHYPEFVAEAPYPRTRRREPLPGRVSTEDEMDPGYHHTKDPEWTGRQVYDVPGRRTSASAAHGVTEQPRRASDSRKMFANDRSPLQRLELTLDSMTKEEKRARVQAAEQRARERAANKAAAEQMHHPEGFAQGRAVDSQGRRAVAPITDATSRPEPHDANSRAVRQPAVSRGPEDCGNGHVPVDQASRPQTHNVPPAGLPKRNLSFRERAAKNDPDPTPQRADSKSKGGFSLSRSGSNKLRKDPPGDPWYYQRVEAERAMPAISGPLADYHQPASYNLPAHVLDKKLPPVPKQPEPVQHMQRRATEPIYGREYGSDEEYIPSSKRNVPAAPEPPPEQMPAGVAAARRRLERQDSDHSEEEHPQQRVSRVMFKNPDTLHPGEGLYRSPVWLDEWKQATVGTLDGKYLDVGDADVDDRGKAWWEGSGRKRSVGSRARKAEAFDGEYENSNAPTRFKPPLYLQCGPLLRYCGIRSEKFPSRSQRGVISERQIWRGSVMIVTRDADSSYEIAPTLRLFVQDIELLPPPPHQVNGEVPPEYVDPIAGHPKLGRRGETLYVRPVEHLDEAKDLSRIETDEGLFESSRSPSDAPLADPTGELPGSFASRQKRMGVDGEKTQKYKDVRGFRLHAEHERTFWRFNIEIELREKQQRIGYRINRGPCMSFWVPPVGQAMNIMFHSCNGFSASVNPDELSGPDPMWRDVLNSHQSRPFHVMIGGGDQVYNDRVGHDCALLDEWLDMRNPLQKHKAPFTAAMQSEMEEFYLERYCMWFSQGLFGLANSQIPMVNMYDDHDIFDGYGSYPDHYMKSPVFSGLGAVAFKYYMLFQHQTVLEETEQAEPSWIMGVDKGPYIKEFSRSVFVSMGGKVALLAVDCRTERTEHEVVDEKTWKKIMDRLYVELKKGQVEHLLVLLGVPVAYPRLVWLENILTSRLMDPVKVLGRTGMLGKALNNIDGGVEVLDDLNDHWTAKNHKHERSVVIEDLQDLAIDKSLRVTLLSGDVHLAAVGQFYSNPKLGLPKHRDPRYMINLVSSAIANAPPSDLLADVLNKRNKVHHFDKRTDESMVPLFHHGVDGKSRNNKRLLPHRNWCSIQQWTPGRTPPPTPPMSDYDGSASPPLASEEGVEGRGSGGGGGGGGLFRRFSFGGRGGSTRVPRQRPAQDGRPPVSGGMGLLRSFSRRNSASDAPVRPGFLTRTLSLGSAEAARRGGGSGGGSGGGIGRGLFGLGRRGKPDDGGINGQWGYESDDGQESFTPPPRGEMRLRGGALPDDEFSEDDDSYFVARPPRRAQTLGNPPRPSNDGVYDDPRIKPFHRTPTGLSVKQMRNAQQHEVDVEGGLDICLNVEVNAKDPTGITVPYRMLVPRLHYDYDPAEDEMDVAEKTQAPTGFKRFLSLRKRRQEPGSEPEEVQDEYDFDD